MIPLRVLIIEDSEADAGLLPGELRRGDCDAIHARGYTTGTMTTGRTG